MSMRPLFIFALLVLAAEAIPAHAARMDMVSDLISTSPPGVASDHRIQFTTTNAVPPSGKILITFAAGAFTIPLNFDYTDVDMAVWNGATYVDRPVALVPSNSEDGVAVTTGTSGKIEITLSSGSGIPAGTPVQLRLGTNATFTYLGVVSIINPSAQGSYRIGVITSTNTGTQIDYATAMIAVVLPVTLNSRLQNDPPVLSSGLPFGVLPAGSNAIELSFATDRTATCRYSTTTNTTYSNMLGSFIPHSGTFFHTVVRGHQDNTSYTYFIRCIGIQGATNLLDYPISFSLAPTPISNTSSPPSTPGSITGQGNFVNGSPVLYLSSATLTGFTSPGSTVQVLKDGVQALTVQAGPSGNFHADLNGLERGAYTFSLYSIDSKKRKSASNSSTINLNAGTNSVVSGIVLPPTVSLKKDTVAVGESVTISGEAPPQSIVEVSLTPLTGTAQTYTATTTTGVSGAGGDWELLVEGKSLQRGTYRVKAFATLGVSQSDFSTPVFEGVGEKPASNLCAQPDINGDGKVNLVDFSILLTSWGTSNANADLNCDGKVNLADFSILLFNWTG